MRSSAQIARAVVGVATALLFLAVLPGNIAQLTEHRDAFGLDTDGKRLVRLSFQPVLMVWALWATDAIGRWRRGPSGDGPPEGQDRTRERGS